MMTSNFSPFDQLIHDRYTVMAVNKAAKRRKILDTINKRRDEELSKATIGELEKQLAEIDG